MKNGLNGNTAQPLVAKEPEPEQGTVLVHMSVLAVQLSWSVVLIIQNVHARSKRRNVSSRPWPPFTTHNAKMTIRSVLVVEEKAILVKAMNLIQKK